MALFRGAQANVDLPDYKGNICQCTWHPPQFPQRNLKLTHQRSDRIVFARFCSQSLNNRKPQGEAPPLHEGCQRMSDELVELDVIAPVEGKRQIERSQIVSCTQAIVTRPARVVLRLADGSTLIVTKASSDRAGLG